MVAINRDETRLTADDGKIDESAVIIHCLSDLLQSIGEHPVELAWKDCGVSRNNTFTLGTVLVGSGPHEIPSL
jgi:hypothetical protein